MKNEIYYENLNNDRKAVLWLLVNNRDYRNFIHAPRNGRKLNRLSTKQLVAKIRAYDKNYSKRVANYVANLDTYQAPSLADKLRRIQNASTAELLAGVN